jgi:hypothetical protein
VCGCVGVCGCGCVYKIENFRTLSAPSEIASLREAISSSAAFEQEKKIHGLRSKLPQLFYFSNSFGKIV